MSLLWFLYGLLICLFLCSNVQSEGQEACSAETPCNDDNDELQYDGSKRRIIFDSDPGVDDAFALIWLLEGFKDGLYKIEGLTTVHGNIAAFDAFRNLVHMINITLPSNTKNKRPIRDKLRSIPIAKMHKTDDDFVSIDDFMGFDGLSGISPIFKQFPKRFTPSNKIKKLFDNDKNEKVSYSEDLIISLLNKYPYEITLICVGPLTNLILAEQKQPGILSLAKDIMIMGGVFLNEGNVDPLAEFNFKYDSNALYEFFNIMDGSKSAPNVFIFPLDITNTLKWTVKEFELLYSLIKTKKQNEIELCRMKIEGVDDEMGQMYDINQEDLVCSATGIMHYFLEKATEKMIIDHFAEGIGDFMELHDLSIIGYIKYPQLFDFKYVKCSMDKTNGMIWFDQRLISPTNETVQIPNCFVALNVEKEKFVRVLVRDMVKMLDNL